MELAGMTLASVDVYVGNIGCVATTDSAQTFEEYQAAYVRCLDAFRTYVEQSRFGYGKASGESVTLYRNGEPVREYIGANELGDE